MIRNLLKSTPFWSWAALLLVLLFIGVSAAMIVDVSNRLDEVEADATLIDRLTALRTPIEKMDVTTVWSPGMADPEWPDLAAACDQALAALRDDSAATAIGTAMLERVEGSVTELEALHAEPIDGGADGLDPLQIALRSRAAQRSAVDEINGAIGSARARLSASSVGLAARWHALVALLMLSCVTGVALAVMLILHDRSVRARRRVLDALRASESRIRLLVSQVPAVMWTTDRELRFTSSLGGALAALSLAPDEVVGKTLFEYFGTADPEFGPIAAHTRALAGEAATYEIEWQANTYESHVQPLRDDHGAIVGCVGVANDVTRRTSADRERQLALIQLEHSSRRLEQLLRAASGVETAETVPAALRHVADAVRETGWGSVAVYLFDEWRISDRAYSGFTPEQIAFIESQECSAAERASLYARRLERHRISRSYFIPGSAVEGIAGERRFVRGRRPPALGDTWSPDDLASVPLRGRRGEVIGQISLDDPRDGRRPDEATFRYLEFFGDLAAHAVERLRLIEERRRTAEALRQSEQRFRQMAETLDDIFCLQTADRVFLYVSPAYERIFGQSPQRLYEDPRAYLEVVHPEDRDRLLDRLRRPIPAEPGEVEFRIVRGGEERWLRSRGFPALDERGRVQRLATITEDVTMQKEAEAESAHRAALERLLFSELDHRVRNNLASLLTLVNLGRQTSESVEAFADSVRGRIQVMASVHRMLSQSRWSPVRLTDLIRELMPADRIGSIDLEGPDVAIRPRQATAMAMVVHELLTNSVKYGALRTDRGRIELAWTSGDGDDETAHLRWSWRESGGPQIELKPRPGVGSELIRGLIRSELGGTVSFSYPPEGVHHRFATMLDR